MTTLINITMMKSFSLASFPMSLPTKPARNLSAVFFFDELLPPPGRLRYKLFNSQLCVTHTCVCSEMIRESGSQITYDVSQKFIFNEILR